MSSEYKEAFSIYDTNNDGFITKDELRHMLETLGDHPSEEQIDRMMKDADLNGDGKISLEEFISLMQ